jgi:predicted N-acetyltransferase YhbS
MIDAGGAPDKIERAEGEQWSVRMIMSIRIAHLMDYKHHIPDIAARQQEEFGYLNPDGTMEQRIERLSGANDRERLPISLVALSEDQSSLVGTANVLATTLTHKHLSPWLSAMFVATEHRGKGIASALALAAASQAGRLGFDTIYLFTPRNESLYARLGWATFDRVGLNGTIVSVMARSTRSNHET